MKLPISIAIAAAMLIGVSTAYAQDNKASPNAPGQDRTCLVTTSVPGDFANRNVKGKWLPRTAAKAQAKDPATTKIYDYTVENEDLLANGTYASAEELCKAFPF